MFVCSLISSLHLQAPTKMTPTAVLKFLPDDVQRQECISLHEIILVSIKRRKLPGLTSSALEVADMGLLKSM